MDIKISVKQDKGNISKEISSLQKSINASVVSELRKIKEVLSKKDVRKVYKPAPVKVIQKTILKRMAKESPETEMMKAVQSRMEKRMAAKVVQRTLVPYPA